MLKVLNWAHTRFKHDGNNIPENYDPLYILSKAEEGEKFRCVEYSIIVSAALNSLDMPSRVIGIKTQDVETNKYGAGHVVSEVYLSDIKKWVFMDPQMNYIPFLNNIPLNAVEYRQAISSDKEKIKLRSTMGVVTKRRKRKLVNWVSKYLYYFDAPFDASEKRKKCKGKSRLMLVPLEAKEPQRFQVNTHLDYLLYTNSIKDFYKKPTF